MDEELALLDGLGQADLVRRRVLSPRELVRSAVEAIQTHATGLGAPVVFERFEAALEEAGRCEGPFAGLPLLVKDLTLEVRGWPYTAGTRFLKRLGWRSPRQSALVDRYQRAGFVLLGQTATSELGGVLTTEPVATGVTRNPWDVSRSTGGSSGGSAAAVAAGLVAVAHGSDGAGSLRIPASACGLVGLKPSRGRVPLGPQSGHDWAGVVTQHVLTRSVRDTAAVLEATAGALSGDPVAAPGAVGGLAALSGPLPRLRVGVLAKALDSRVATDPECVQAAEATARLLEELGCDVEEAWPAALAEAEATRQLGVAVRVATARSLARFESWTAERVGPGDVEPYTAALAERGRATTAIAYAEALEHLEAWGRRLAAWWDPDAGHDLLVTPTLPTPPWPLGHFDAPTDRPLKPLGRIAAATAFTAPFNVSGQPAISLPLAWSRAGLPLGVQLVGAPGAEDTLLRVAAHLEEARPWRDRRPPPRAGVSA